jgi:beta-aspartyl-peptidase (threonine type)
LALRFIAISLKTGRKGVKSALRYVNRLMNLRLQGSDLGAVARDTAGHLAAATSTGGLTGKRWRRIGDSPLIGAVSWADRPAAAKAGGEGVSCVAPVPNPGRQHPSPA